MKLFNDYVGMFGIGSTAPGYITLGSAWAYGDVTNVGKPGDTSDGGSYGGVAFTSRPDSLSFYVKRTHAQEAPANGSFNKEERASVLFYSWTGTSVSKVTTGMSNAPVIMDMQDREKDVLGKITEGVSGDVKLVAANEYYIEGDIDEWTYRSFAIDYKSDAVPEKMNMIFSASDYFDRSVLGGGNALWVDDVQLIYNSRLKSLTVGKTEVSLKEGIYDYRLPGEMSESEIKAVAFGAKAKVNITKDGDVATIVVSDETAKGEKSNTYTLTFKGAVSVITAPETVPSVVYGDVLNGLGVTTNSTEVFHYAYSSEGVLEQGADGMLHAVGAGTVLVKAFLSGNDDFSPAESDYISVTVDKAPLKVSLADNSWVLRGANVSASSICKYSGQDRG